jgi:hypothetical protein
METSLAVRLAWLLLPKWQIKLLSNNSHSNHTLSNHTLSNPILMAHLPAIRPISRLLLLLLLRVPLPPQQVI